MMDWLPFSYEISNKPYGRQNLSQTRVRGSMPVELEEIELDTNDPVITILHQVQPASTDHYSSSSRSVTYAPPCEMTYYRTTDGRLVRPIYFDSGVELTSSIAKNGVMPDDSKEMKDYPLLGQYTANPFSLVSEDEASASIYRIVSDDRELREAEARERASSILKCGDVFYKEVPEPVIELQFSGMIRAKDRTKKDTYDKRGVVLKINAGGVSEILDDSVTFRIDEYDLAVELAYEIGSMGRGEPHMFGEVFQVDSTRVEFDAFPNARMRLAAVLDHQKAHGFGDVSIDNVQQWVDVVRMMADGVSSDAEVAAAARAYFEALPPKDSRFDTTRQKMHGAISRFETVQRQHDPDLELALSGALAP